MLNRKLMKLQIDYWTKALEEKIVEKESSRTVFRRELAKALKENSGLGLFYANLKKTSDNYEQLLIWMFEDWAKSIGIDVHAEVRAVLDAFTKLAEDARQGDDNA